MPGPFGVRRAHVPRRPEAQAPTFEPSFYGMDTGLD